jgi:hypothetical protein
MILLFLVDFKKFCQIKLLLKSEKFKISLNDW